MNNEEYWLKRYEQLAARAIINDEVYIKRLLKHYAQTQSTIEQLLSQFYLRYAKNGKMDYTDAKKLLSHAELENYTMTLEEFREKAIEGGYDEQLEEIYLRGRISRLQAIMTQIKANILGLTNQAVALTEQHLMNTFQDTYYRSIYELQHGTGFVTNFAKFNESLVQLIVNQPWENGNFSSRIWNNQYRLMNQLEKGLAQGTIRGDSLEQMAQFMADRMGVSMRNARRLVNTESANVISQATARSYEETGLAQYKFSATLDIITSEICREMDGRVFEVKDRQIGINAPPMHVNCRSHTVPYFEDETGLRVARDKDGKRIYVDRNMNYKQWYDQHVANDPEYQALEKAHKNRHADKKQYERYQETLGDQAPKTFEDFQRMKYNDSDGWGKLKALYGDAKQSGKWKDAEFASPKKLQNHINDHLHQYPGFTIEQYTQRARELLTTPALGNIEGFTNSRGWRFRFDRDTNDFVIGRPDGKISTLFKPDRGREYWLEQIEQFNN